MLGRRGLLTRHWSNIRRLTSLVDVETQGSPSVSRMELEKFTRISNEWWDPQGAFKYLHTMNRPRIQFIREMLQDVYGRRVSQLRAVDVGCGGGLASEAMARLGLQVLGVDAARENVGVARAHLQQDPLAARRLEYRQITAEQLSNSDGQRFDVVVSLEVIEHVNDPVMFVRSLTELARPGGLVFISTMNQTLASWLLDIAIPEYLLGVVPRGTHDHAKFMEPEELSSILRACDVETLDTRGLVLDPLSNKCHLVPRDFGLWRNAGVQANYIMAARKKGE
ncbi:Hexaprenyldihydroxybenzoate methyltransferase, mitochondrial [Coemansia sp. RSA 552]|nr:Hexaprenyldihydroxybenzoate methyltransferase, mitochondrial [Coemansia sp. RSA 552]KAJ2159752.1 Hexaprenyldihydroxybenzoate methyltransferase, mitochondrial [Coemansia sp. RSA 552]